MKYYIIILLTLALLLTLVACTSNSDITELPMPIEPPEETPVEQPMEISPPVPEPPENEPFPGKIAIITNDVTQNEEEYRSATQVVAKYGEDKIVHKIWPVKFPDEGEQMIRIVRQLAEDPEIKALIINQAVQNTMPALDKLLEIRDDVFIVLVHPTENPPDVAARANLVLMIDELLMGPAMVRQAHKMGATTFVHLSFPRHMGYLLIYGRYMMIKEECAKLDIEFVEYTVPDPTGDIGMAGSRQFFEEIPKLVAQYGPDTAFFSTNCGLQIPLIKAVVDSGAIYPSPCCPSPFHGFPLALGLISEGESVFEATGTQDAVRRIVDQTIVKLAEKDMLGRVSTWPVPSSMMFTNAAAEYAIKWINGKVPKEGIDKVVLEQCMSDYAGTDCFATRTYDYDDGKFDNWLFVMQDYFTYDED